MCALEKQNKPLKNNPQVCVCVCVCNVYKNKKSTVRSRDSCSTFKDDLQLLSPDLLQNKLGQVLVAPPR